jgi:hypothetical protein
LGWVFWVGSRFSSAIGNEGNAWSRRQSPPSSSAKRPAGR